MPDIARLDADGMLVAVETVTADAHRTDPQAGTVALPDGHDMRQRLRTRDADRSSQRSTEPG